MIKIMLDNALRRIGFTASRHSTRLSPASPLFPSSEAIIYEKAVGPKNNPHNDRELSGAVQIIISPAFIVVYREWVDVESNTLIVSAVNEIRISDLATIGVCESEPGKYRLEIEYRDSRSGRIELY